jgi:hypothetical protein
MKRVALGNSKVLLRNGANILKIIICEPFILNFSILGLIFHNLSKKCLNRFTDDVQAFPTQLGMASQPKLSGLGPWADISAG